MWQLLTIVGASITALYYTKRYFAGGVCKCRTELSGKTVIVTGGNSGIGKFTASILASKGAVVIIACRNTIEGRRSLEDITVHSRSPYISCEALDLTSFKSIRSFVEDLKLKGVNNIYALINNAGVFYHPFNLTEDGYEATFQTNYLGPFLLTYLMLKENLLSKGSRIVNVSSDAHRIPKSLSLDEVSNPRRSLGQFLRYGESKLCLNLLTRKLASKVEGVRVYSIDPGNVETDVYRHFPLLNNRILFALQKPLRFILVKTPVQGAQTVVHTAISEDCINDSGSYFRDCKKIEPSKLTLDDQLADDLWLHSLAWCGDLEEL